MCKAIFKEICTQIYASVNFLQYKALAFSRSHTPLNKRLSSYSTTLIQAHVCFVSSLFFFYSHQHYYTAIFEIFTKTPHVTYTEHCCSIVSDGSLKAEFVNLGRVVCRRIFNCMCICARFGMRTRTKMKAPNLIQLWSKGCLYQYVFRVAFLQNWLVHLLRTSTLFTVTKG